jgi:hypothetical protein
MRQAQACKKQGSRCKIEPPLATPSGLDSTSQPCARRRLRLFFLSVGE